jgi:1-acyl-sn-glycerol-3-phosphate acyltransferase
MSAISNAIKGAGALLVIGVSTLLLSLTLFFFAFLKFISPAVGLRRFFGHILTRIVELWISVNSAVISLLRQPEWDVRIPPDLDRRGSYVVNANHQSWVDILVLQHCFNRRLPMLVFFLKKELIWVPVLGLCWWALEFPFMHRPTASEIARNPKLLGKDLKNARKACEKFRDRPVAMMSFSEGTRFSEAKRESRKSPYRHLLQPKVGGIGMVLYALGDRLDGLIDVTIAYPGSTTAPTFWQLVSGQVPRIAVRARKLDIPPGLMGRNFREDRAIRRDLEQWINGIWNEKDVELAALKPLQDAGQQSRPHAE